MVSALDSGASGPALAEDIVLCSWARHFTLTMPLSTQVYKWVPANLMLGVTLQWTSITSRGEQKYSQSLHATETRISSSLMGHLARMQTLPTLWTETESRFILPAHGASCSHIIELLTSHLYHFIENTHGQPIRIQKSRCIIYSSELVQPSHHALCLCRVDCVGHCMFYGMVNNLIQKRTFLRKYAC